MGYYTQFSPRTVPTERAKLWNPSKTLGIINPDKGCLTCVGYAPSQGRRCRNPIRADNRALITETLDDIAYLPSDSPAVISRLRAIVGRALCCRYHQDQAETVFKKWQRMIQSLSPQTGERTPAKPVQGRGLHEPARDRRVEDLQDQLKEIREAMAKLQEQIDSQRHQSQECEGQEERAAKDRQEEGRKQRRSEERKEALRKERKRLEEERLERERLEEERLEEERLEKERLEEERLEKERLEKERLAKEKREDEEKQQRKREDTAANERIRQRAQKIREEREREKREKEQKEREEWNQLWAAYQERWAQFRASASDSGKGNIRDAIPWPVKSGSYRDVKYSNVKEFFQKALSSDEDMRKVLKRECSKWHSDKRRSWVRDARLSDVDEMMVEMICRVVTELIDVSAGKSSEFLG
jgi:DNA repair exonuclease SbcCD ATPase subunit